MKRIIFIIISIISINDISAQSLQDLSFGTDDTFEVITWNIENYPKNNQVTIDYVVEIIKELDADVIAFQEISDTVKFKNMLNNLSDYNYSIKSSYYAGLAYIYKKENISINDIYEIYTTSPYWSAFPRSPMILDLNFKGANFFIINNHYKCCGDGYLDPTNSSDEEARRLSASTLLKQHIDNNLSDKNVIVVGDLNDILTDDNDNNVFKPFLDDNTNYSFVDMDIATGNNDDWSYPGWPSHLDHILITNELFEDLEHADSDVQVTKVDDYLSGGWSTYDSNISDHRPVGLKLMSDFNTVISSEAKKIKFENYPNPFAQNTTFYFDPINENSQLIIFSTTGELMYSSQIESGQTSICVKASNLTEGVFIAKLLVKDRVLAITKLLLIK